MEKSTGVTKLRTVEIGSVFNVLMSGAVTIVMSTQFTAIVGSKAMTMANFSTTLQYLILATKVGSISGKDTE